jgi:hypothetical protein
MQAPQHDVDAMTFRLLMERADNALQNRGVIMPGRGAAMADWQRFSAGLSEQFFEAMKAVSVTETLIDVPPRRRLNINGSAQWGDPVAPLTCVEHLFTRGVCQVRHNIVHGNKLLLDERDVKLINGAHYVLEAAIGASQLLA